MNGRDGGVVLIPFRAAILDRTTVRDRERPHAEQTRRACRRLAIGSASTWKTLHKAIKSRSASTFYFLQVENRTFEVSTEQAPRAGPQAVSRIWLELLGDEIPGGVGCRCNHDGRVTPIQYRRSSRI
jgi:hypothetical protein